MQINEKNRDECNENIMRFIKKSIVGITHWSECWAKHAVKVQREGFYIAIDSRLDHDISLEFLGRAKGLCDALEDILLIQEGSYGQLRIKENITLIEELKALWGDS